MATILIMEDDWSQSQVWSDALKSAGYSVLICRDGSEALATALATKIDLVVSDIFVRKNERPIADGGILLIGRLRSLKLDRRATWLRDLPIIAVSGAYESSGLGEPLDTALLVGADIALRKPVSGSELLEKVAEMLPAS